MDRQTLYEKANSRAREKKKFFSHFLKWAVMSIFFIGVNVMTSDYFWAIFPIMAWGIGVAMHGIKVYTDEWEDNETARELRKLKRKYGLQDDDDSFDMEEFKKLHEDWKDSDFV